MKAPFKRRGRVVQDEGPDPIDVFVGQRVRERRLQAGLSQKALAEPVGVTAGGGPGVRLKRKPKRPAG